MARIVINVPDEILNRGVFAEDVFDFLSGHLSQVILPNDHITFSLLCDKSDEPFHSDCSDDFPF